jgi:glycosyltransferase involved in cell wall biosynthesis
MIYQRKNQLFLVKCLKRLVESGKKKSILVLIGPKENESQEYLNKINEFVSTSSLKKNVIILDPQKNINEFLIASDMLVFASSSEGFPNVVAESMVSGLPTVTLELGCINPFISKKNGIIIDRYNKSEDEVEKQFTNALSKVYSGKIKYDRREVRKQGLKLFSSTKADKEYYQIYSEIKNR